MLMPSRFESRSGLLLFVAAVLMTCGLAFWMSQLVRKPFQPQQQEHSSSSREAAISEALSGLGVGGFFDDDGRLSVDTHGRALSEQVVALLNKAPGLKDLHLAGGASDDLLLQLNYRETIELLDITNCATEGQFLAKFAEGRDPQLNILNASSTRLTDRSLAHLCGF